MPRPTSKDELLQACDDSYPKLIEVVGRFSQAELRGEFPFEHRDRNVRDVVAHLYEWHRLMLGWYKSGMAGNKPEMPAKGYTWQTTRDLNAALWKKHQKTTLNTILNRVDQTHSRLQELMSAHTNEELFQKCHYEWTGSTSLGSYLTSATSSHYNWATKLLRKYRRALGD